MAADPCVSVLVSYTMTNAATVATNEQKTSYTALFSASRKQKVGYIRAIHATVRVRINVDLLTIEVRYLLYMRAPVC